MKIRVVRLVGHWWLETNDYIAQGFVDLTAIMDFLKEKLKTP